MQLFLRVRLAVAVFTTLSLRSFFALDPLTQIEPDAAELGVFPITLSAALARAGVLPDKSVIHVVGATSVEDSVDWSSFCQKGASVVLVGPQVAPIGKFVKGAAVLPREKLGQECVTVVRGLYSRGVLRAALGDQHEAVEPDMVIVFNADVYMDYWRRTLGELLQIRKPVVVSMYCEYEGGEITKVFDADDAFAASALEAGDEYIRKRYRGDANADLDATLLTDPMPQAQILWAFERNPHAHLPPQDCLAKPYRHGVRNSFWMAFVGAFVNDNDEL